jgi:predicted nucleic acid-binding protein
VAFVVLLDANVLYPAWLRDALLRMVETKVFQVRCSARILDEAQRNIKTNRPDIDPAIIDRTFHDMREFFEKEGALVTGYEPLEPAMTNHQKDRHVLAAAIVGRADVIVTENLADFPKASRDPYGIDAQHPDEFLCNQWELDEEAMTDAIAQWIVDLVNPPLTLDQLLQKLERHTPQFCKIVRASELAQ